MFGDLKPFAFLRCLFLGHEFRNSHSRQGKVTCMRCRYRKDA
jgi:hypothetical protein